MDQVFDVAIIGGGINGCGTAADAALRGLSVVLLEKDDLASKTSSHSTKLIHGGLRYLEHYNFSLVRKALNERQVLLTNSSHLTHPLLFILPCKPQQRSRLWLRMGLFLYDHLSFNNKLPRSKLINRTQSSTYFSPLVNSIDKGFSFYDCITDDARLTITNALQAKNHGAQILTRTELIDAQAINKIWHLNIKSSDGQYRIIKSKTLVNATGPWINSMNQLLHIPNHYSMTLVKGSHLVVPKLYESHHAYLLQHDDQRIVFVIPYYGHTLIGTTEVAWQDLGTEPSISKEEIDYLLQITNSYFKSRLTPNDLVTTWSGVRALLSSNDESLRTLSRNYITYYTSSPAPAVAIYGGKITTYRQAALETIEHFKPIFPDLSESSTHAIQLPGAFNNLIHQKNYLNSIEHQYPWLDKEIRENYISRYGTRTDLLLKKFSNLSDMGEYFGHGLYQAEVDYLQHEEWAMNSEDILWRRTKLGLCFNESSTQKLARYLENYSNKE